MRLRNALGQLVFGGLVGAGLTAFFDPTTGRRRRAVLADRATATVRRGADRAERAGRGVGARVYGTAQRLQHLQEEPKDYDDVTLTRKVETEIFRDADAPKGQVLVNVQEGVVQLRGEVPSEDMLNDLVEKTRKVQGVREVESLLHLPGSEAPMHE